MNPELKATAVRFLTALLAFTDDALSVQSIPAYDPISEPYAGPVAEASDLQSFYLPHRQLPPRGQELWRDFQGMIDLRICDPYTGHVPAAEMVRFHKAADALREWLVEEYQLRVEIPDRGKPKATDRERSLSADEVWDEIKKVLFERHNTDNEHRNVPITQGELASRVKKSQSFVSKLFEDKSNAEAVSRGKREGEVSLWDEYLVSVRGEKPGEDRQRANQKASRKGGRRKSGREHEAVDPRSRPGEDR